MCCGLRAVDVVLRIGVVAYTVGAVSSSRSVHVCWRAIHGQLVMVGTYSISLGVTVSKQADLQDWKWNYVSITVR